MMFHGCKPCARSHAVRDVRVCVLPLPGPARIASVSATDVTAASCDLFRFERRSSEFMVKERVKGATGAIGLLILV